MPIGLESTPSSSLPAYDDDNVTVITTSTVYLPNQDSISRHRYADRSPRTSLTAFKKYKLVFRLKYEAQPGESVSVLGCLDRLGGMKDFNRCPMKLKSGSTNIWQSSYIEFDKITQFFTYKYAIVQNGALKQSEQGFNRIAELDVLPDVSLMLIQQSNSEQSTKSNRSNNSNKDTKDVIIEDEW